MVTVNVESSMGQVGQTIDVPIEVDSLPTGLAGYVLDISIASDSVARIVAGTKFPSFGITLEENLTTTSVRLRAADLAHIAEPGDKHVLLATLQMECMAVGAVEVSVNPVAFDDEVGSQISPTIDAGHVYAADPETMAYTIVSMDTDVQRQAKVTGDSQVIYCIVDYWPSLAAKNAGFPPMVANSHSMNIPTQASRIIRNADRWHKIAVPAKPWWEMDVTGEFVNQESWRDGDGAASNFEKETVTVDMPSKVRRAIESSWPRIVGLGVVGDWTNQPGQRGNLKVGGNQVRRTIDRHVVFDPTVADQRDPNGALARQDMKDLVNLTVESVR